MNSQILFDFQKDISLSQWSVVDDIVMGGRSSGRFDLKEGHGHFYGSVSLENNGGFSSVRYSFDKTDLRNFNKFKIRLKGDGKNYQFRAKAKSSDYQSYITEFSTTGDWQWIEIPINTLYPSYRGRKLDMPNFNNNQVEEIAFLIANKKNESFELLIDQITIE